MRDCRVEGPRGAKFGVSAGGDVAVGEGGVEPRPVPEPPLEERPANQTSERRSAERPTSV